MALNPLLILAGQQPDIAGGVFRADEAGFNQGQRNRENALQAFQRDQGAALLNGDRGALDQFAQFSPEAAFSFRGQVEGREQAIAARQAAAARAAQSRQAAQAQAVSDADRAKIEQALNVGDELIGQGADAFNAGMAQLGLSDQLAELGITADNYQEWSPAIRANFGMELPAQEFVTLGANSSRVPNNQPVAAQPEEGFRSATPEESAARGAAAGQFGPNGRFYPLNPPSGMSLDVGSDGQIRFSQGSGVTNERGGFTDVDGKSILYATRASSVLDSLDANGGELTRFGQSALAQVPVVGNALVSDEYQMAQRDALEFTQAILRKDSGAAIPVTEEISAARVWIPQFGDSEAVLAAKSEARRRAVDAIRAGMSGEALLRTEEAALGGTNDRQAPAQAAPVPPPPVAPQIQLPATQPNIAIMQPQQIMNMPAAEFQALDVSTLSGLSEAQWDALFALGERYAQ